MREYEVWDNPPDPWEGDHDIEYWVWQVDEDRLMPATPEETARIREEERTRIALCRLEQLRERERSEARSVRRRLSAAWRASVRLTIQWLQIRRRHGLATRTDEVRVE